MKGICASVSTQRMGSFLQIIVEQEGYMIDWLKFARSDKATDELLQAWTEEVLKSFRDLERAVNRAKSVHLDQALCKAQLLQLAKWGRRAYYLFFSEDARQHLAERFQEIEQEEEIPAPTFISKFVPFPWEVLYEGDDYHACDPGKFWGLSYSPARNLTPDKHRLRYPKEQTLPSDMLLCLHRKLHQAHQFEWPEIEKLVRATKYDRFLLLGSAGGVLKAQNGEALLEYLDQASHNMLHFACHCRQYEAGTDALLISLIDEQGGDVDQHDIELETYTFVDRQGKFQRQPLVFLNACQSAGDSDDLRKTFNLPKVFIERGAAAIVATICPVPDLFAAAFAKVFYQFFLRGQEVTNPVTKEITFRSMTIGEALRATRWYFLERHNNPLGLAYGLYSPAYYRLAQPPNVGGIFR